MINVHTHIKDKVIITIQEYAFKIERIYPANHINVGYLCFVKIEVRVRNFIWPHYISYDKH